MHLVPIEAGISPRILQVEIAGRSLLQHLINDAARGFSLATIDGVGPGAALYVRADAWFGPAAFASLASQLEGRREAVVVMSHSAVLAVYLAAEEHERLRANRGAPAPDRLPEWVAGLSGHTCLEAAELDEEFPPRLVADLFDVARIEAHVCFMRARAALLGGVRIRDPHRIFIRGELVCGPDVEIDIDVIIEGRVVLGHGVRIGAGCILSHTTIGDHARIGPYSVLDRALVGSSGFVGPFARIRPGSRIGDRVQIGNFVEIKQSDVGDASRINHLAFVGDADLGANVTIGAGVITCNHDGRGINPTRIGADAYVGSGSQLVAPLLIGEKATIGAGSTITDDVPAGKLTLARARQVTIDRDKARPAQGEQGS